MALIALASIQPGMAAAPMFEEHLVWDRNESSMLTHHCPTIFVSKKDTLLAAADARYGDYGDFSPHHIAFKRSIDQGRTWSKNEFIGLSDKGQIFLFPNFIQPRGSDRIFLIYSEKDLKDIHRVSHVWVRHSDDDGQTWSKPADIVHLLVEKDAAVRDAIGRGTAGPEFDRESPSLYGRKAFFSGPGIAIQLSAHNRKAPSRLIVPVLAMQHRNAPAIQTGRGNVIIISDDQGKTWKAGGVVPIGGFIMGEPAIVELANGDLLFNSRFEGTVTDRRLISVSKDGGLTWSQPVEDGTVPKYSRMQGGLFRYSHPKDDPARASRILFSFPHSRESRTNMTVMLSYDDHKTWPVRKMIHTGPSFYSNMTRLSDGTIVLVYGKGESPHWAMPGTTVVARFNLEWLTDGKDSLARGPQAID